MFIISCAPEQQLVVVMVMSAFFGIREFYYAVFEQMSLQIINRLFDFHLFSRIGKVIKCLDSNSSLWRAYVIFDAVQIRLRNVLVVVVVAVVMMVIRTCQFGMLRIQIQIVFLPFLLLIYTQITVIYLHFIWSIVNSKYLPIARPSLMHTVTNTFRSIYFSLL